MDTLACAEATCLWLTKKFTNCQATLQKLESEGKSDLKLAHNLLVVEHAITGSAEADRIASQLELISNDKLTVDDGSGTSGSAAADVSAGAVAGGSRSRSSSNLEPLPLVPVRDDLAVAQLNRAILLYHQLRFASAASLLEPLATNVEALAEGTAVRVLTLLLEIFIEGRQLPRAVAILHRLEGLYGTLAESYAGNRSAAQQQQQQQQQETQKTISSLSTDGSSSTGGGSSGGDVSVGSTAVPARDGSGSSFSGGNGGARRTLALPRVSRWCTGAMERSKALLDTMDRPLAAPDLKLLIKLYRSRLHALAHNTRAAKRELKAVISTLQQQQLHHPPSWAQAPLSQQATQGQEGHGTQVQALTQQQQQQEGGTLLAASPAAEALLLAVRAQLELYRGRARKSTKLLLAMLQDPTFSQSHQPLLLNNLGLVHHQQGKHALALLYFSRALAAEGARGSELSSKRPKPEPEASSDVGPQKSTSSGAGQDSPKPSKSQSQPAQQPCTLATVPIPAVMYNAGLQHLMLHNYEAARKCFAAAAPHYLNTPLLWLRTGEAALGMYRRYQEEQEQQRRQRLLLEGGGTMWTASAGGMDRLVEGIVMGPRCAGGPTLISTGSSSSGAAVNLRRLVLPTGAAPSPADADPAAVELLSEAVVALQTALQQLDAKQEAHDQWQSSSSKLEEGLLLAPPPCGLAATPEPAVSSTGGGADGGSGGGAGVSGGPQQGLPVASGDSMMAAVTGPAERYPTLPLQQQQLDHHQQIDNNQQSRPDLSNASDVRGSIGEEARHSPQLPHLENGIHEQQGTDASAALSEELCTIRRAVLANLAYAHLQAEDWCAALQAAKALLAVSALPGPAAAGSGTAGAVSMAATVTAAEYAFLAHNYAAEALCYLDRPADAVEYLSLWLMTAQEREGQAQAQLAARSHVSKPDEDAAPGVSTSCGSREDGEQYALGNASALAALSGPAALAATATNLGAVFASQGELEQAAALVRQALTLQPGSRSAVLLLVYCELAAGNTSVALALLKQHGQPVPR